VGRRLATLTTVPVLVAVLAACDPVGGAPQSASPPKPALPWVQVTSPEYAYQPPQTRDQAAPPLPSPPAPTPPVLLPAVPVASPSPVLGPCLPLYGPGTPVPVNVTTAPGPVLMTWFHNGDLATTAYWVGVQPLAGTVAQRSAITWTRVAPPAGCRDVTVTVPGLQAGTPYLVWLDADSLTPETGSGSTRHTLNRVSVTPA
jgi:hypothetical protein